MALKDHMKSVEGEDHMDNIEKDPNARPRVPGVGRRELMKLGAGAVAAALTVSAHRGHSFVSVVSAA